MAKQRKRTDPQQNSTPDQQADTVYRVVDVVGVSETSWEDAGRNAVETAAESLRDLRVAEVTKWICGWKTGKSQHSALACRSPSNTKPDRLIDWMQ